MAEGGRGSQAAAGKKESEMLVSEGSTGGAWSAGPVCEKQGRVSATRPLEADSVSWMLGPGGGRGCRLRKDPSGRVTWTTSGDCTHLNIHMNIHEWLE